MANQINVAVKEDGVYLNIQVPIGEKHPSKDSIEMQLIEAGVVNYDDSKIDMIVREGKNSTSTKISDSLETNVEDEMAFIDFSKNNMEVTISFTPPQGGGASFDKRDIIDILQRSGVVYGILNEEIDKIVSDKKYDFPYLVAKGLEKIDGEDGYLKYFFETEKKTLQPKALEDGSVDYHNLELVEKVEMGETLVTIIQPTNGLNGKDVKGNTIYAKPGKPVKKLPKGKNVLISDDQQSLISEVAGQIDFVDNKINIQPILEISTSVDNSTGNIDFNGAVIIHGGVLSGFSVKAKGNIEVHGVVEGAKIVCGSDLFLFSGVMGREKAEINVRGDITAKFIDSAKVIANGIIRANSIMHSDITSDNSIILSGKNGLLVGGRICAAQEVNAVTIGSPMATKTNIVVGATPSILEKYKFLIESIESLKLRLDKNDKVIKLLKSLGENIDEEKKNILVKAFYSKIQLNNDKIELEKQLREIIPNLENGRGKVGASKIIYPGVKIMIGSAGININDEMYSVRLKNKDNKIVSTSYH